MTLPSSHAELSFVMTELPANVLEVDPAVQRDLSVSRVAKISGNFTEHALGILTVSRRAVREDGTVTYRYVVLDGQTRVAAVRKVAGTDDTTMPLMCQVYTNLSRKEEAEIFLSHNDRALVRKIDRFRIALVAQEQWAVEINFVAAKYGFEINPNTPPGRRVTAVSALEKVYRMDGGLDAIDRAFDTITTAWGHDTASANAEALAGLGLLYARHPGEVDFKGLGQRLAASGGPHRFMGAVTQRKHALGIPMAEAAYRVVVQLHDKGRRSRRIGA